MLLKDGVKYLPYSYTSEEELTQMIIEHYEEIFGPHTLYFDPQTMKTSIGIEARNDGILLAMNRNMWYMLEVELSKHPLHDHIIPQITKFSIAYEDTVTRKKIIDSLYTAIRQDVFKNATTKTQKIEDLHKTISDLIDTQPTIVIIIDQKTPELDYICKKLPFSTRIIEFKTYTREKIGVGVHIHEFQPLFEKIEKIEIRETKTLEKRPKQLEKVLDVAQLIFKGEEPNRAFKNVAKQHGVCESTVRDKCTRVLGINTDQFKEIIKDKNRFVTFLKGKYPHYENLINEKLA